MKNLKAEIKELMAGDFEGGPLQFSLCEVREFLSELIPEVLNIMRNSQ